MNQAPGTLRTQLEDRDFRTFFEQSCIGFVLIDRVGISFLTNPKLQEILGFSNEELATKPFIEFAHPEDIEKHQSLYSETISGGRDSYQVETRLLRKDGSYLHSSLSVSLVRSTEGSVRFTIGMVEDATSQALSRDEFTRSRVEIGLLNAKLEQSSEQLQQFAYAASHDLKEPLRAIENFSKLLEQAFAKEIAASENGKTYMDFVLGGVSRMQEMIDGLLDLSRISTIPEEWTAVDIGSTIQDAIASLVNPIDESGAIIELAGPFPEIQGNAKQVKQLFQNLITNSIKFSGDQDPRISISCSIQKHRGVNWSAIQISDNGVGIDERYSETIFQPFRRFALGSIPGLGMGLSLCRQITALHGGTIAATGKKGEGMVVTILLPISD